MLWYEVLAPVLILAGVAFFGWMLYGRKSGPTGCIGCGKCVADGVCILTGKRVPGLPDGGKSCDFPVDNPAEMFIINVSENSEKP